MSLKKIIFLILIIPILSGCSITYNLDISEAGFNEKFTIIQTNPNEKIDEYSIPSFFGKIGYEDVNANFLEKVDGIEYYNSEKTTNSNQLEISYNYKFNENNFKDSNIINTAYKTTIIKKYDHNNDGENDYMLISTDNNFFLFEKFPRIERIKINIICHYEVISSNADEINKNIYTWYLDKDNIKPINIIYNPENIIDYRNLWQKILDGDYFNLFTISIILLIIIFIIYKILKKHIDKVDAI